MCPTYPSKELMGRPHPFKKYEIDNPTFLEDERLWLMPPSDHLSVRDVHDGSRLTSAGVSDKFCND